jgi:hypothetical protein
MHQTAEQGLAGLLEIALEAIAPLRTGGPEQRR